MQQGEVRPSSLMCVTQEDYANSKAWKKDVVRWMIQMNDIVKFHEAKNETPIVETNK